MRRLLAILLLAVLGLAGCAAPAQEPVVDEAAVYTAVVHQIYTEDDTFGGTWQPQRVYLIRRTDDGVGDPQTEQLAARTLDEALQAAIVSGLAALPAEWVWVDGREAVPLDPETGGVEGGAKGAIITLGNIHQQDDGTLHVPASIYVGNLAAGGQTFVLEQTEAGWQVTGTTGTAWIS